VTAREGREGFGEFAGDTNGAFAEPFGVHGAAVAAEEEGFGFGHGRIRVDSYFEMLEKGGQIVEDPQFLFEFELSRAEVSESRGRVQYFRLGHALGTAIFGLTGVIWMFAIAISVIALIRNDQGSVYALSESIPTVVVTSLILIVVIRDFAFHSSRLCPRDRLSFWVGESGIRLGNGGDFHHYPWDQFTVLIGTKNTHIILTRHAYVVIPKRAIPTDVRDEFVMFVQVHCLKQSRPHDFPVILNDSAPAYPPGTEASDGKG
jgi:hypothetical protein